MVYCLVRGTGNGAPLMVTYKIWDDSGKVLVRDKGTCYYMQDYYKDSGAAWWHTYNIEECVGDAVLHEEEVNFWLTRVSRYVPELPPTMQELFDKGVLLDCRKRSAAYSRMVGGYVRILSERGPIFPGFTARYQKAIDYGMDESLALLFACSYWEVGGGLAYFPRYTNAHSLTHRSIADWYDLWRTVQLRDEKLPKMHETVRASYISIEPDEVTQVSEFCQHPTATEEEVAAGVAVYKSFVREFTEDR